MIGQQGRLYIDYIFLKVFKGNGRLDKKVKKKRLKT